MNARSCFFIAGSIVAGFAVGYAPRPVEKRASLAKESSNSELTILREDALGAAFTEFNGENDLASLAHLGSAVERLDSAQLGRLIERMERIGGGEDKRLAWLFTHWMKRDRKAATAWIQSRLRAATQDGSPGMGFEHGVQGRLIQSWAKEDPEAAFSFAKECARTGFAGWLLDQAIQNWPEKDPARRLAMIQAFPASKARDHAQSSFLWRWAEKEPEAALKVASSIGDQAERAKALNYVLKQWIERDPKSAFEQIREFGITDPYILSRLMANGAEKDPQEAVEWLSSLSETQFARHAPQVVARWADRDPIAALTWALENGVALSSRSTSEQSVKHDGLGRMTVTIRSSVDPLAAAFAAKPEETLSWLRSLPPGADRERILELSVASSKTVEQAAAIFSELNPESAARAAQTLAARFDDEKSARTWIESLPSGPVRLEAWKGYGGMSSNVADLAAGPERDAMLSGRATNLRLAPVDRLELISQIGDPTMRRDLFEETFQTAGRLRGLGWLDQSLQWLEKADVPEDWKVALRSMGK